MQRLPLSSAAGLAMAIDSTIYTAVEVEELARKADAFNEEHPDNKINWCGIQLELLRPSYWQSVTTLRQMLFGACRHVAFAGER